MDNAAKTERDKLILSLLADCGLRLGELLALRVEDIWEPKRGELALKVRGKGSRDRLVPVSPGLVRRLRRYLAGTVPRAGIGSSCRCARGQTGATPR